MEISEELFDSTYFIDNMLSDMEERFTGQNEYIINESYMDNEWILFDYYFKSKSYIYFDSIDEELQIILKSWILNLFENKLSPNHIRHIANIVIKAMRFTNNFSPEYEDEFNDFFNNNRDTNIFKAKKILTFLEYAGFEVSLNYYEILIEYTSSERLLTMYEIPSSKDVLKFDLIIKDFFNSHLSTQSFLVFFPVYFWWCLTNIIPLRISEFCFIKLDCLSQSNEGYILSLPRSKTRFTRELKYDKILISNELAENILRYKELTKDFDFRETLISYQVQQNSYLSKNTSNSSSYPYSYYYGLFDTILNKFYKEVVQGIYNFRILDLSDTLEITNDNKTIKRIRPNDTRYFAFLNMMLQGYHPIEMAALGGHTSIYSQLTYYNHLEYWVDSDLLDLANLNYHHFTELQSSFDEYFIIKSKIIPEVLINSTDTIPLEIGYCTDNNQNCPVDSHYICPYWRISSKEYTIHKKTIAKELQNRKSSVSLLFKNLIGLYNTAIFNLKDERYDNKNSSFNFKLRNNAKIVQDALYKLYTFKEKINYE